MIDNRLVLSGLVREPGTLRYSPAGIPLLDFTLEHASVQAQEGMSREAACAMRALASGDTARQLSRLGDGARIRTAGFISRKSRNSMQLVLHVTKFEVLE